MIYPSRDYCFRGIEAIAQARIVAKWLQAFPEDRTNWEVWVPLAAKRGRVDLTYETSDGTVNVYEVKVAGSGWGNPLLQVNNYVAAFQGAGVNADQGSMQAPNGTASPAFSVDWFLTPMQGPGGDYIRCGESQLTKYELNVSQVVAPGVIAVYQQPADCFNPETQRVQVPSRVPVIDPVTGRPKTDGSTVELPDQTFAPRIPGGGGIPPKGPVSPQPPFPPDTKPARVHGDPHLVTIDGLGYEMQSVGEFQLVRSDALGLDVQVRTAPVGPHVSALDRIATVVGGRRVEIDVRDGVLVDGTPVTLAYGEGFDLGGGARVGNDNGKLWIQWPGEPGQQPMLEVSGQRLSFLAPAAEDIEGLLGDGDGEPRNDFKTSAGEQLAYNSSASVIHGSFADSWRLESDDALFTYGEGETTESFTDLSFPSELLTINDIDDALLAEATERCKDAGVVDGRQFDDCVLDWAQTQNMDFVEDLADVTQPVLEPGALTVGDDGSISEDFDGPIAPNFSSARYGSGAGSGTFAGPFGRDSRYVFYVPETPRHVAATISFDIIAFGTWSALDGTNARLTLNRSQVWRGNVASQQLVGSGTTATGRSYDVYRVTTTVATSAEQLNLALDADVPLGSDRTYAIDNLTVQLRNIDATSAYLPAQTFDVSLPTAAAAGDPAAGMGELETRVSEDRYDFTLSSAADVQLDLADCAGPDLRYVRYKLTNRSTGLQVDAGDVNCLNRFGKLYESLPAGDYRVSVLAPSGATGSYSIGISKPPAPQTFGLSSVPKVISDGDPAIGAGNLETTSSEDIYTFTTAADGAVRLGFSDCTGTVATGGHFAYTLTNTATSTVIANDTSHCGQQPPVRDLPTGPYRLSIKSNGYKGTYRLNIDAGRREFFDISLPFTAGDGTPEAGMGNLETSASEDVYAFSVAETGNVQFDLSDCSGWSFSYLRYKLVRTSDDEQVDTGNVNCQNGFGKLYQNLPAGDYKLSIVQENGYPGTYKLGVSMQPEAQTFALPSVPTTVTDGVPATGAGNLETTSSEDVYTFEMAADGAIRLGFSDCVGTVASGSFSYRLTNTTTNNVVTDWGYCGQQPPLRSVPAGNYRLSVTKNGSKGTYKLGVIAAPRQTFTASLPLAVSNGAPESGMGNLETSASEDVYAFSVAEAGNVQFDLSNCSGWSVYYLQYKLTRVSDSQVVDTHNARCSDPFGKLYQNLPAGDYKLSIIQTSGYAATYKLGVSMQPQAQTFELPSVPTTVTDGVPAAGAGNLETTSSEDIYTFAMTADGAIRLGFSDCVGTVASGYFNYKLTNTTTNNVVNDSLYCGQPPALRALPEGSYRLSVTKNGSKGSYKLGVIAAPRQTFAASLPLSVVNGVPESGMGNLETSASEDVYAFSVVEAGNVQFDLSDCQGWSVYYLRYKLTRVSNGEVVDSADARCDSQFSKLYENLAQGEYRMSITHANGYPATYQIGLSQP